MRRLFQFFVAAGIFTSIGSGHNVIYQSDAGRVELAASPTVPVPMKVGNLTDGSITVQHFVGELCIVKASLTAPPSNDPLVQVLIEGPGTALDVHFIVHVLRNPQTPAESVTLSGLWKATGDQDIGFPDPKNCDGSGSILATVSVTAITIIGVKPTSANLIGSAHTDDPIWTSSAEVSHADPDDLVLGGPLPLRFTRYYASLLASNGISSALGNNLIHNFDQ